MNERSQCGNCGACGDTSRRRFLAGLTGAVVLPGPLGRWLSGLGIDAVAEVTAASSTPDTARYPIPAKDGVSIDKAQEVILVRYQGKVMAFLLACPHENTALRWKQGDVRFQCPKHDSKYLPDGIYVAGSGRATRNMDRFAITLDGSSVVVHLNKWFQSDTHAADWTAAVLPV
jgi:nitrite reductase/ring-hydroxylating ferredoxin subunit